jgi:type I restriction enzyme S subunit
LQNSWIFLSLKFFYYALTVADKVKIVTGSAQPQVTTTNINPFPIVVPPLAEQHRIVAKVDELMILCDQLENQHSNAIVAHEKLVSYLLNTLTQSQDAAEFNESWQRIAANFDTLFSTETSIDALKQTVLQLAVMGKLVPQDLSDEPASELLKRIQAEKAKLIAEGKIKKDKPLAVIADDEKPFELPKGWEWARLSDVIKVSSGNGLTSEQMDKSGKVPVYGGNGINGYHTEGNINVRTLVIGRVGFYCGSIHITPELAWVTDNAFITRFSEKNIYLEFLYWLLRITNLKENEGATAQPVISGAKIYPIVVALPPLAEQHRIVAKVDELMAICDQLKTRITTANQLQQKLADVLVSQAVA